MWEAWSAAPRRAKLLNLLSIILTTLTLLSCCISFGAELFTTQFSSQQPTTPTTPTRITFSFYHDRIESPQLGHLHFADLTPPPYSTTNYCTTGGRLLVAFAALAFLALTATLALAGCRLASAVPAASSAGRSVRLEFVLSVVCAPLLVVSVASYAGCCFQQLQGSEGFVNVRATGYGYSIVGVLLAVVQMGVCWAVRQDEQCWLGTVQDSACSTDKGVRVSSDGYQQEKTSGFGERKNGSSDEEDDGTKAEGGDEEEERSERQSKRGRHKSHKFKSKHRGGKRVKIEMTSAIDPNYPYSHVDTYQTEAVL